MKPLDRLSEYLRVIERRMRLLALSRGAAVTAFAALVLTIVAVLVANNFAFSNSSVIGARVFLFLGLALALGAALIVPVIRLNRRTAARKAEQRYPQFEERLLTFTERVEQTPNDPFLHLLADDTLAVAQQATPKEVTRTAVIFSFSSAALAAALVLIWLGMSGPGFLGYGTSLLWGGLPKGEMKPFYAVKVDPGNKTIRKRADQIITATLQGFTAPKVRFFAKYASSSKWEQADMRTEPGGNGFQFLIAGVPETLEYYVEAGGVRSSTYKLNVIDLPSIKKIKVTYHFPSWSGMPDQVEDPGGDLRAVEGTVAEVSAETDRPLTTGAILLDDGSKLPLRAGGSNTLVASVHIQKDGLYHFAAVENGEDVRLGEDYIIEAMKDHPPEVKITRPGRDFRASPIEEVTVAVEAKDDFGLKAVELHYSVNGGPDKVVPLMTTKGGKESNGSAIISLEDFKLEPGDMVSLYALAKDARVTANTDMFFIEAQPFEKNYSQSQESGGGGGGGGGQDQQQDQISQRQKEIITATWNQAKGQGARGTDAENSAFLSSVQSKLREQAQSLSNRMKARQLEGAGDSFKSFVESMDKAVEAMVPAAEKLKGAKWQDALAPEQKALQYLLRAEQTFRDIQVAFGRQQGGGGGGGGGGGATRDMQGLFDLELDTEKNQYESQSQRSSQAAGEQQRQIDDMLEKLKQLAKRQQELAEAQRKNQQTPQQRYEQEMLRREAEKLQQQMQQMAQQAQNSQLSRNGQQSQSQSGQQSGQQSQSGQSGQQSQQQSQQGQSGQMSAQQMQQQLQQMRNQQNPNQQQQQQNNRVQGADPQQLKQTLDKLQQALSQAMQDMRQAASSQQAGTPQSEADARRAADRLNEATNMLQGLRSAQSGNQVESMARQAEELARRQQDFEGQMRKSFGPDSPGVNRDQANQLAGTKESEIADLKKLEQEMQAAVRDLQGTQRQASTKLREALGEMQQQELSRDMQRNADWIRRGMGGYAVMSEAQITQGLNQLRDQLKQVQQAMGPGTKNAADDKQLEATLNQVEAMRRALAQIQAQQRGQNGQRGQQQGQNGQQQGQNGQQQGQRGQQQGQNGQQQAQNGQQQGGQQQGGQQQGGQQQGGQQQGGQQQGGQQQGGQQQGGQQQGGQQQGGQQQGGQQQGGQQQGGSPQGGGSTPQYGMNNGGNPWNGGYRNGAVGGNWNDGPIRQQDYQQTYRDTMQALTQLQQQLRDDPAAARDVQGVMRDLRQFDPFTNSNDPLLNERIASALAGVEQVEMELRRKVEDTTGGGSVRSPAGDKVPQGYADAIAEYYRKLSNSKK